MIREIGTYLARDLHYSVDTGTPFAPEDCDLLINIVENGPIKMAVNGMYWNFKEGHETGNRLYRPGFQFLFWFYEESEADAIVAEFAKHGWNTIKACTKM